MADVGWVIDELARRQAAGGRWGRARLDAVGMSGHSFGARTTQALAGEAPLGASAGSTGPLADPRLRAFIAFSPGFSAREGMRPQDVAQRFGGIRRPMLCITGTKDGSVIGGDANYETRRAVYQGLPPGGKAELVLAGADHYTFGGQSFQTRPGGLIQREPGAAELAAAHQALVARISTDWWLWRLLDDTQAKGRLLAPAGLLPGDSWLQD